MVDVNLNLEHPLATVRIEGSKVIVEVELAEFIRNVVVGALGNGAPDRPLHYTPKPKPRRKRRTKAEMIANIPGQKTLPGLEPTPPTTPIGASKPEEKSAGGAAFPFGANVGSNGKPLVKDTHLTGGATGQAIMTKPGETLAEAKKRVKEAAATPAVTA